MSILRRFLLDRLVSKFSSQHSTSVSSHRRRFAPFHLEVVVARALLDNRVRSKASYHCPSPDKPTSSPTSVSLFDFSNLVASNESCFENPNLRSGTSYGTALDPTSRSNTKFNTSFACESRFMVCRWVAF